MVAVLVRAGCVLFTLLLGSAVSAARPSLPFEDDPRLSGKVSLPLSVTDLEDSIQRAATPLALKLHVREPGSAAPQPLREADLLLQFGLHRRPVVAAFQDLPASECLRALATSSGASWRRVERKWVLTDQPGLERIAAVPVLDYLPEHLTAIRELKGLSPDQYATLVRSGLTPDQLSPRQRLGLLASVQHDYFLYGDLAPESLDLEGVRLEPVRRRGDMLGSVTAIQLVVPSLAGPPASKREMDLDWFRVVAGTSRRTGVGSNPRLPIREPSEPSSRTNIPAANLTIAELRARISTGVLTVEDAALSVARLTRTNLVISTQLRHRPIWVPEGGLCAGEVLTEIVAATGGRWVRQGDLLVHVPQSRVERVAWLRGEYRKAWQSGAFEDAVRRLTGKQRARLRSAGSLSASELTDPGRDSLRRCVACAFVESPFVSAGALDLTGVKLRYRQPNRSTGAPPGVDLEVPTRSAGTQTVASAALP
jgi:hypothetical protein